MIGVESGTPEAANVRQWPDCLPEKEDVEERLNSNLTVWIGMRSNR